MSANTTNNKISNLIASQVPFFVRNDHPKFITFLEKYYEFLEQKYGNAEPNFDVVAKIKNVLNLQNVDLTEDKYAEILYSQFLKFIPSDVIADKTIIIKHVKDFYRAKGTEKSVNFLFNIMFGVIPNSFYYPKKDILKVSDGKWYIPQSLRVANVAIANVSNNYLSGLEKFNGVSIKGLKSNAEALVEHVELTQEMGTVISDLYLSNIDGEFLNGEKIEGIFADIEGPNYISANVYGGIINTIKVTYGGTKYKIGDPVIIESDVGKDASATVSKVSKGIINKIDVSKKGAGFRIDDLILVTGGGGGTGANAIVLSVYDDGSTHPNSYNIVKDTVDCIANTDSFLPNISNSSTISSDFETYAYSNLATQYVIVPPTVTNLYAKTGRATLIQLSNNNLNSNISFGTITPLNINNQISITTSIYTDDSNTTYATVYPGFNYNLVSKSVGILSESNTSNLCINYDGTSIKFVSTILVPATSNLSINTYNIGTGYTNSISILGGIQAQHSSITFGRGYKVSINAIDTYVTSYFPDKDYFYVSPAISDNIIFGSLVVYEPTIQEALSSTSNVAIANGNIINIKDVGYRYAYDIPSDSSSFKVMPVLDRILTNVSFSVLKTNTVYSNINVTQSYSNTLTFTIPPDYTPTTASYSNVGFVIGDSLQIQNTISTITSMDYYNSSDLIVSPGFTGGLDNVVVTVIRIPFNDTSNLTITTATATNVIELSDRKEYSNVFFETGDVIYTNNQYILITSSNTQNNYFIANSTVNTDGQAISFQVIKKPNSNTTIENAMSYWTFANTGPAFQTYVINTGSEYSTEVALDIQSNNTILNMGTLGAMEITSPGINYQVGDIIEFINQKGNFGLGANAIISSVNASGSITGVQFTQQKGHIIGGRAYRQNALPSTRIKSATGSGGVITVTAILGDGESLLPTQTTLGTIEEIRIDSSGKGYLTPPSINLTQSGDRTAKAEATVITGVYDRPGYFINDDGQVSSFNYIEDRDFYQNFSYVIRSNVATELYRDAVFDLTHPIGMRMYGEYNIIDVNSKNSNSETQVFYSQNSKIYLQNYSRKLNVINVSLIDHGFNVNDEVSLEFLSGNISYVNVTFGGLRYANGNFTSTSNLGSGLSGYYNVDSFGTITSAKITNYGSNYTEGSIIKISPSTANAVSNLRMNSFVYGNDVITAGNVYSNIVTMNLSDSVVNSNIYFTVGDTLRLFTPSGNSYDIIVDDFTSSYSNTSNLKANAHVLKNTSNLIIKTGILTLNTSNLTVNTSYGTSVNDLILSNSAESSNVVLSVGDIVTVNGKNATITFVRPISETISVVPGIDGNLVSNVLYVTKKTTKTYISNISNLILMTGSGSYVSVANIFNKSGISNLVIKIAPQATSNLANVFLKPNNTNLILKTALTDFTTEASLFLNVPNTSNLILKTGPGSNVVYVNLYSPVINVSNLMLKTTPKYSTNIGSLYTTPNTSNLVFKTGSTANIANVYLPVNTSNLILVTAPGLTLVPGNLRIITGPLLTTNVPAYNLSNQKITTVTKDSKLKLTNVVKMYAWAGNSSVNIVNGSTIVIGNKTQTISNGMIVVINGITTNVVNTKSNSNTFYVSPAIPANIKSSSMYIQTGTILASVGTTINVGTLVTINTTNLALTSKNDFKESGDLRYVLTLNQWAGNSNVSITNGSIILLGPKDSDNDKDDKIYVSNVVNVSANSPYIYVSPGIDKDFYRKSPVTIAVRAWAQNCNTLFTNGQAILIENELSAIVRNTVPNSSIVYLSEGLKPNSYYNSNIQIYNVNTISLANVFVLNTSNLTVSTGFGNAVNVVYLNKPFTSSNVSMNLGSYIVINGVTANITGNVYTKKDKDKNRTIYVSPGLPGNLKHKSFQIYVPAWAGNSNVKFANNDVIVANGIDIAIVNTRSNSSTITISPSISGNTILFGVPVYTRTQIGNSNVKIENASYLSINSDSIQTIVQNTWPDANVVYVGPAFTDNTYTYKSLLTYSPAWAGNSNTKFSTGYLLTIGNNSLEVNVTNTLETSSQIRVSPELPANLTTTNLTFYQPMWAGNSVETIANGRLLSFGPNLPDVNVENTQPQSSTLLISPGLSGNFVSNNFLVYNPGYAKYSFVPLSNGDFLTITLGFVSNLVLKTGPQNDTNVANLYYPSNVSNLVFKSGPGAALEQGSFYYRNQNSNLVFKTSFGDPLTTGGFFSNTNTSNLIVKVTLGSSVSMANLYSNSVGTSNLVFRTNFGVESTSNVGLFTFSAANLSVLTTSGTSNTDLINFCYSPNISDLTVFTSPTSDFVTRANLYHSPKVSSLRVFTPVGNTTNTITFYDSGTISNLAIFTLPTANANLVTTVYPPNVSNLTVYTSTGSGLTNVARLYLPQLKSSNLTLITLPGDPTNVGSLHLPQSQVISNLTIYTAPSDTGSLTNIARLYLPRSTVSNLTVFTAPDSPTTNIARIYRPPVQSNLTIFTPSGSTSNIANLFYPNSSNLYLVAGNGTTTNVANLYFANVSNLNVDTGSTAPIFRISLNRGAQDSNVKISNGDIIIVAGYFLSVVNTWSGQDKPFVTSGILPINLLNEQLRILQPAWAQNSNVKFGNNSLIIADDTILNVTNVITQSNTIYVSPALTGNAVSNLIIYQPAWAQNSNVTISNGAYVIIDGITSNVTNCSPTSNTIYLSPATTGGLVNSNLRIYQLTWSRNSNVAISNGDYVTINGILSNVVNSSTTSDTLYLSPAVTGGLTNSNITINQLAWSRNSNNRISTGDYVIINGIGTRITDSSPTSNIVYLSPAITSGLVNSNLTIYQAAWGQNSNTTISNGNYIIVNGIATNVVNIVANTNIIYLSPAASGSLVNSNIVAGQLATSQRSSVNISNGDFLIINDIATKIITSGKNSDTLFLSPAITSNLINSNLTIYAAAWARNSNVHISNTGYAVIDGISTPISDVTNSSITVSYGVTSGLVNSTLKIHRTGWLQNSNVKISNGDYLIIDNVTSLITSLKSSDTINSFYPVASNLINSTLRVYQSAWAQNSNVKISNAAYITVSGLTANVVNAPPQSASLLIYPTLKGNLVNVPLQVYAPALIANSNVKINNGDYIVANGIMTSILASKGSFATIYPYLQPNTVAVNVQTFVSAWVANSSVPLANGYLLTVNGLDQNIRYVGFMTSNQITVSPALPGGFLSNTALVYIPAWVQNSNVRIANNNVLTVNGIDYNVSTTIANLNQIYISSKDTYSSDLLSIPPLTNPLTSGSVVTSNGFLRYEKAWLQNSNVTITNNYVISVQGADINVVTSLSNVSVIQFFPFLSSNITANNIYIYKKAWVQNSNVKIANDYIMIARGIDLKITDVLPNNHLVRVSSPYLTANYAANTLTIYRPAWAANANVPFTVGNTLIADDKKTNILRIPYQTNEVILESLFPSNLTSSILKTYLSGNIEVDLNSTNPDSNKIKVYPSLPGNLTSELLSVSKRVEVSNSANVTFTNGSTLLINDSLVNLFNPNLTSIVDVQQTSNTIIISPSLPGNLKSEILTVYLREDIQNSNVTFANSDIIEILGAKSQIANAWNGSNSIWVSPGLPGNTVFDAVKIYKAVWAGNSNTAIAVNDTLSVNGNNVKIIGTTPNSNVIVTTPGLPDDITGSFELIKPWSYVNLVSVTDTPFTSNLRYKTDPGGTNSVIMLYFYYANVSNLTVTTYATPSSELYLSDQIGNSNVKISNGDYVIVNGITTNIREVLPTSNVVYLYETVDPNLSGAQLQIYQSAWAKNSNVKFAVGSQLTINNKNVFITAYNPNSNIVAVSPSIDGSRIMNVFNVFQTTYSSVGISTSNVYFAKDYELTIGGETALITSVDSSSSLNVIPEFSKDYVGRAITVTKYGNFMNVIAVRNSTTGYASYNLNNNDISTVNNFAVLWQGPATFNTAFVKDTTAKLIKDGMYKVVDKTSNEFNVALYPVIDSITINNAGRLYNSNGYIVFTGGGGSGANAEYVVNSNGSIVKVILTDLGSKYISTPTANANGTNANIATFTVNMKYLANTNGYLYVTKKTT